VIIYLATIWFGVPSFAQAPAFVVQDLIFDNSSLKPNAIVPVDLDRDGDIDIVAGLQQSNGDNTLEWFQNNGSGSFTRYTIQSSHTYMNDGKTIKCADIDGDGDTDIAGAAYNGFHVYWNSGSQSFTEQKYSGLDTYTACSDPLKGPLYFLYTLSPRSVSP
jgi:hypothetical protein